MAAQTFNNLGQVIEREIDKEKRERERERDCLHLVRLLFCPISES